MRALRLILAAAAVAALGLPASAHESEPAASLRFEAVVPAVEGLAVEARDGIAPTLVVDNRTGERFEVLDEDGVAFLRIGPRAVQANLTSPSWWASERPDAGAAPPASARPGAEPRWVPIAGGSEWAWFDHRLGGPAAVAGRSWSIPARLGERALRLTGTWVNVPLYGLFRTTIEGVEPAIDGLRVEALPGAVPALFVDNATGEPLEVPGPGGEPFLRIGPDATFQADPTGRYVRVGATPRWGWVEPRAGWEDGEPTAELLAATEEVRVGAWTLAARLGDRPVELRGELSWIPVRSHHADGAADEGGRGATWFRWALIAVAGAVVVWSFLGGRRRA